MSCCSCHKTPCSCSTLLEEARPYRRVGSASFLLASDRNGNPVNLEKTSFGIPLYLNEGGVVVADGSKDHPIILPHLQELLDGQSVLIRNGRGIAGVIAPTEDDTYLVFQGGVLGFSKVIPRDNAFDAGNISVQAGKLVTLACAIDGNMTLGLLSDGEGDYISLGADGVARVYNFCDAADTTELASIFGCYNGKIGKIKPSAGKIVRSNDEGTAWVVGDGGTTAQLSAGGSVMKHMYPGSAGSTGTYITDLTTDGPSVSMELPWDAVVMVTFMITGNNVGGIRGYTSMMVSGKQYGPTALFPSALGLVPPLEVAGEGDSASVTICLELTKGTHVAKFGAGNSRDGATSVDFAGITWLAFKKSI